MGEPDGAAGGVFLAAALAPFAPWLAREDVSEVLVNRPGEVWIEDASGMTRHPAPALDAVLLRRLAEQVARASAQAINRANPLLAATLADGTRLQFVAPPATRRDWVLAMRRHRLRDTPLEAWSPTGPLLPRDEGLPPVDRADPIGWLREAVTRRATILIAGGTSSGKTTFLNALISAVPAQERFVVVEDTPEIRLRHDNAVGLVAVHGTMGEAQVGTDDLLRAALRLRPDRIVLGELRGTEAVTFLRAVNTGHPGSFSTIHANSCLGAVNQLALMVMQAGLGLSRADTLAYAAQVVDVVVHLRREEGRRVLAECCLTRDLVASALI